MEKCEKCVRVIREMEHIAPVGYAPFGWGPSTEDPNHYYLMSQKDWDDEAVGPTQTDVVKICEVENPVKRIK